MAGFFAAPSRNVQLYMPIYLHILYSMKVILLKLNCTQVETWFPTARVFPPVGNHSNLSMISCNYIADQRNRWRMAAGQLLSGPIIYTFPCWTQASSLVFLLLSGWKQGNEGERLGKNWINGMCAGTWVIFWISASTPPPPPSHREKVLHYMYDQINSHIMYKNSQNYTNNLDAFIFTAHILRL